MRNKTILYLVEGETEQKFLKSKLINAKNKNGYIKNGLIMNFNPYCAPNINKVYRNLSRENTEIRLIIDTDIKVNENFKKNLKDLSEECKKLIILTQNNNFEDEVIKMANSTEKKLCSIFGATSIGEFKSKYIKTKQNIEEKFKKFDINLYCNRIIDIKYGNRKIEYKTFKDIIILN